VRRLTGIEAAVSGHRRHSPACACAVRGLMAGEIESAVVGLRPGADNSRTGLGAAKRPSRSAPT